MLKDKSEKLKLSDHLEERRFFENHANDDQVDTFKKLVGEKLVEFFISQGISINVLTQINLSFTPNRNDHFTMIDSIKSFDDLCPKEVGFTINFQGKKVLFQLDNNKVKQGLDNSLVNTSKNIGISFFFESDFLNGGVINTDFYSRTNKIEAIGGTGLYSDSIAFFKFMKKIISLIDQEVNIDIQANDNRRYRLYKKGLSEFKNVTIIPPSSHETPRNSRNQK